MPKNSLLKIRVTLKQREDLELHAKSQGFNTISSYVRRRIFHDLLIEDRILELKRIMEASIK
jgi:hypothetical protein